MDRCFGCQICFTVASELKHIISLGKAKKEQNSLAMLVLGSFGVFLIAVDFSAANIALATIREDFHSSLNSVQWVLNAYGLALAAIMVSAGRLGDSFGHRRLILVGSLGFAITSLGCGFAPNIGSLIFCRALQGVAAALLWPSIFAVIIKSMGPEKKSTALGIALGVAGFSMAFGPLFAGLLMKFASWRWIFFFNVPFAMIVALGAKNFLNKGRQLSEEKVDVIGNLLLIIGLFALIFSFDIANSAGVGSEDFICSNLGGLLLIALFLWVELRRKYPLFDTRLLGHPSFSAILIARLLFMYCWVSLLYVAALLFQFVYGLTPLESGLWFIPLTVGVGIISPFWGRIIDKFQARRPTLFGISLACMAFSVLVFFNGSTSLSFFLLPFILLGFSTGFVSCGLATALLESMPKDRLASASGIYYMVSMIGGAIGISLSGVFLDRVGNEKFLSAVATYLPSMTKEQMTELAGALLHRDKIKAVFSEYGQDEVIAITKLANNTFSDIFLSTLQVSLVLCFIVLFLSFFFVKKTKSCRMRGVGTRNAS